MILGADFIQFSLIPILIACFASIACALPGNFLVLRRQAMVGDAISHVVLPGIVFAFLLTGTVSTWPMIGGAAFAALFAVFVIELIHKLGRIESGAAMGVVFTTMFAVGVILLEQSDTSAVNLDVEHALYGNLESLIWLPSLAENSYLSYAALAEIPAELWRMIGICVIFLVLLVLFWRPLKISTFDEGFAASIGLRVATIRYSLVVCAALAAVMAFNAVGSIIVIAMFVCPAAAARLMTNRLLSQIYISVVIAVASAMLGFILASHAPLWFGYVNTFSSAGMIAVVSGLLLALACLFGRYRMRS